MQTQSKTIDIRQFETHSGQDSGRESGRASGRTRNRIGARKGIRVAVGLGAILIALSGCASQGDFLALKEQVANQHRSGRGGPDPFARIAQLSVEVDAMREEIRHLEGELDLARKESSDALAEIQRTRTTLAQQSAEAATVEAATPESNPPPGAVQAIAEPSTSTSAPPDQELVGYQEALDSWRKDDYLACVEHFTSFLQNYPTSGYADDAAYWLADCTYKHDEFKRAVIRFSDVVRVYPDSPKAPDALYRQGESLLKLGPRFKDAARTVFKRVQTDYPDSERATEAAQQLKRLGPSN
jgi:tol-pal system protein YbgF